MITKEQIDKLSYDIIGSAIEVHKTMGPGLLESIYHKCLKEEFLQRNIPFESEVTIPLNYKGKDLALDFRADLVVDNKIVIELKSVQEIAPIHEAQLLSYMKLLECSKGILINFNCKNIFKEGQRTFVNEFYRSLPDQ